MQCLIMGLLIGLLVLLSAPRSGLAADMPAQPTTPNLPPIPYSPAPYSWTGFYIGGNVGWDWSHVSATVTTASGATGSLSGNIRSFLGGGQAGFNWQVFEPVVIGLEADFQGSQATAGSRSVNGSIGSAVIGFASTPYFGSVRGRVGYAYGGLLFYGTGGVIYGDTRLSATFSPGGKFFFSSATYWSWTAGAGIEAALGGPYSVKLEYLFIGSPSSWPLIPGETGQTVTSGTNLIPILTLSNRWLPSRGVRWT
jgi:outer membrane immunogenic protein